MTTIRSTSSRPDEAYLCLVTAFPPRPIRDAAHYDQTVARMEPLLVRDPGSLTEAEADYLAALTRFVEDYDAKHHAPPPRRGGPVSILKYLMAENDLTASDLGRLLGSRTLGSKILRGERELSETHIRILADRFRIDPGLLL